MEKYRHFKGGMYELLGIGKNSETEEEMVVYKSTETGQIWIRPKEMFFEKVEVDGQKVDRFEKI
ncbi:MAG: DUF1653 domain-containing protein [Patescibacteria group bacterium]|jgi:hypothetical protein|nr:DUF1653 domain-containing protein [Patescibacteria group bacterium]